MVQEWIKHSLESPAFSFAVLPAALLFGLLGSVAGALCSLPMLGAVIGYSASRRKSDRRAALLSALFFIVGTIGAMVVLGAIACLAGQVAQTSLGRYGRLLAGMAIILLGLASLKLLPFKLPRKTVALSETKPNGFIGAAIFGFALGGGVSACSMCCNPGIFVILGVVVASGYSLWSVITLIAYAIGFALPLAAVILGVSLGKTTLKAKKSEFVVRTVAGVLLVAVGFYFLATL